MVLCGASFPLLVTNLADHGFRLSSVQGEQVSQLDPTVLNGIRLAAYDGRDPVGARHGIALMLKAAEDDPVQIASFLRGREDGYCARLIDPLAKVYWVRLIDALASK